MQISASKLRQDLTRYLSDLAPLKPACPVLLSHGSETPPYPEWASAIYSRQTPAGGSYVYLNVYWEEGEFETQVIDNFNREEIKATAEHQALLDEVAKIKAFIDQSMVQNSVYHDQVYPHTMSRMLLAAGLWLESKTDSVFKAQPTLQ